VPDRRVFKLYSQNYLNIFRSSCHFIHSLSFVSYLLFDGQRLTLSWLFYTVTWEGDQAVEECTDDDEATIVERRRAILRVHRKVPDMKIEVEESDGSNDEVVV